MKGPGGAYGRQHQKPALHTLDLTRDGDIHDFLDAHLQPGEGPDTSFEALFPFAHGGDEQRAGRMARLGCQRIIKLLKRLTRPECLLETIG